jgi:predicted TIM-barrel enzyme
MRRAHHLSGTFVSFFTREQCLQRLRAQIAGGKPIIGGGAGTGISAKCAEAGGIDLIIIYNSGRFRMAGRGSLSGMMPYGDANQIVVEMAREVLPVVKNTPVLAGVCGTDPFRIMKLFLRDIQAMGFSGVQNFPTVGLFDGTIRQGLEETDMGYDKEVEMIRLAREIGLLTCPYVFTEMEAEAMARAGADILIPHMGLTTKGSIGARTALSLADAAARVQVLHDAAKKVNPDVIVLCHGGPISEPDDAAFVIRHTKEIAGFFGASSIERLPTETAITGCVQQFKKISLGKT